MKKTLLFIVIVIIITGGIYGIVRLKSNDNGAENNNTNTAQANENANDPATTREKIKTTADSNTVIYVGDGCPHCAKIEEYVKNNQIDEKISLDLKEVWYNKDNANELNKTADVCKIPQNDLGVPLLLDQANSKCYVGEVEITNFLSSKVNEAPKN